MLRRVGYLVAIWLMLAGVAAARAETPAPQVSDPLATAFGTMPLMQDMRLSPDGSKMSFIMMSSLDLPILVIYDLKLKTAVPIMYSLPDKFDVKWCEWANQERLLCSFYASTNLGGFFYYPVTRLVAINSDGSQMKVLMQRALSDQFTQFEDRIVDWLVDDPRHVLIDEPDRDASSVVRLDIYSGSLAHVLAKRENVRSWLSDGHGRPRLYYYYSDKSKSWHYRLSDSNSWHTLHEAKVEDGDNFEPQGFGNSPDQLMVLMPYKKHQALWSVDLKHDLAAKLVFAQPGVDLSGIIQLGKFKRMVAIGYATDRNHLHFFDPKLKKISDRLSGVFSGKEIEVMDESWDKSVYLIHIGSTSDAGRDFFYFSKQSHLEMINFSYPLLVARDLAETKPIEYAAADGVKIPGYLTLPPGKPGKMLPTIILPHGGPQSRDYLEFDWLLQYLAAKGYAVLQSNYRGSGGFGEDWAGAGGFKAWRQVISDLTDGTKWLIKEGIADPKRICVVGWSYGGYAALMSAVEHGDLYRCAVSIAGVTDPQTLIRDEAKFVTGKEDRHFIGTDDEVVKQGSPLRRVAEINIPVLLFHGERDINVPVRHSEMMDKALKKAGKSVEFTLYKGVDHQIGRNKDRIDMLQKIGVFLEQNLGTTPVVAASAK